MKRKIMGKWRGENFGMLEEKKGVIDEKNLEEFAFSWKKNNTERRHDYHKTKKKETGLRKRKIIINEKFVPIKV